MPRLRRPALAAEAERRLRERLTHIGGDAKAMRTRRSWTQGELADLSGLGRMVVSRLERGVGPLDLETLERVGVALEVPAGAGARIHRRLRAPDAAGRAVAVDRRCPRIQGEGSNDLRRVLEHDR